MVPVALQFHELDDLDPDFRQHVPRPPEQANPKFIGPRDMHRACDLRRLQRVGGSVLFPRGLGDRISIDRLGTRYFAMHMEPVQDTAHAPIGIDDAPGGFHPFAHFPNRVKHPAIDLRAQGGELIQGQA